MNSQQNDFCVAIVGAGPVGLATANLLGQYGVSCVIIERNPSTSIHPRAQSIDDESLRTLQAFECAEKFSRQTQPAEASYYIDANGKVFAEVGPGKNDYGHPKRRFMLQNDLDRTLLENLDQFPTISKRFSTELINFKTQTNNIILSLSDNTSVKVRFLLACDGGQSPIRKQLGIRMQGWTYDQDWVVLDMLDDPDTEPTSKFICNPKRPAVSVASPNNGRRYEFMLLPGEDRQSILSDESLTQLLKPFRAYNPDKVTRKTVYTFHARIADKLREGPVFLLGDAAHLTPPFAGQGMNAGIRDAFNVAWKIAGVCNGSARETILDSYELERRKPIWSMIQLAVAMGEFVMPVGEEQVGLTQSVLKALDRFPEARDWLFQMRFKPKPKYDDGLFIHLEQQPFEHSLVGQMIPQPVVICSDGLLSLLDEHLGSGFCMIAQDAEGEKVITSLTSDIWAKLNVNKLRFNYRQKTSGSSGSITNVCLPKENEFANAQNNQTIARPLRSHRDQILLIRPDRYVLAAFFPDDIEHISNQLEHLFFGSRKT